MIKLRTLGWFSSVDRVFGRRKSNIVIAVSFTCREGNFRGQVHLLCLTAAPSEFAVRRLCNWELCGRILFVQVPSRRFDIANLGRVDKLISERLGGNFAMRELNNWEPRNGMLRDRALNGSGNLIGNS